MKFRFNKWLQFSSLLCLSSLIIILNSHHSLKAIELRGNVESCLPEVDHKHIFERQLVGTVDYENKRYYLWFYVINQGIPPFDNWTEHKDSYMIVSLDQIGCSIQMENSQYYQATLEKYVPQPVAKQLALIKLKHEINKAGSVANFLQPPDVLEAHGGSWILFPEDVWAWQQLGLKLPEPHIIIRDISEIQNDTYSPMR